MGGAIAARLERASRLDVIATAIRGTPPAAGAIVSQALGVATGVIDEFSWNAVGMEALSGVLSG